MELSKEKINFLDTTAIINNALHVLETGLYCKSIDSHNYLLYNSAHLKDAKKASLTTVSGESRQYVAKLFKIVTYSHPQWALPEKRIANPSTGGGGNHSQRTQQGHNTGTQRPANIKRMKADCSLQYFLK